MKHLLSIQNDLNISEFFRFSYFPFLPLVIKIAVVFIVISVIMILQIQFRILYIRYKGYRTKKRMNRIVPVIDNLITETVFLDAEWDISSFQILLFRNRRNKQILIDRLIRYRTEFSGNIAILLRKLYLDLELDKDSLKKIRKRRWDLKIQGIDELEIMDIPISDALLLPLTNSKIHELRSKARIAYIKLSKNEPFKFFDVSTEPLLKWDQIELFKTITTNGMIAIPNFARWVAYSDNKSIISFCLKLIVYFQQTDAIPSILKLLDHPDHQLRREAIHSLGKLKFNKIEEKLIYLYKNQPLNCQLEILRALGNMETERNIPFLKREFFYSTDYDIRKVAAGALVHCLGPTGIDELTEASSPENRLILSHCMNPLINS